MHPGGFEVQLAQPLDFYAVTDHAIMLGLVSEAADTSTEFSKYELSESYHNINESVDATAVTGVPPAVHPFAHFYSVGCGALCFSFLALRPSSHELPAGLAGRARGLRYSRFARRLHDLRHDVTLAVL